MMPRWTGPTAWVLVIPTGSDSAPTSSSHAVPVISPLPLNECQPAGHDRPDTRPAEGEHSGHPGTYGTETTCQRAVAIDQGLVSDLDAGDVGDGVPRPRVPVERDAECPGPGTR
jgi:hypothetical protein